MSMYSVNIPNNSVTDRSDSIIHMRINSLLYIWPVQFTTPS